MILCLIKERESLIAPPLYAYISKVPSALLDFRTVSFISFFQPMLFLPSCVNQTSGLVFPHLSYLSTRAAKSGFTVEGHCRVVATGQQSNATGVKGT